ncbi:CU044_5270 family protein [Streptomyces sp. P1-3]|uniref:CU044_5270 family protein n=1 Tax=Streptomyces sp. P1-3 TaxID=3421658 RepID=UPI003D369085
MNDIPPLPERDLPPGRHRLLKEHLMSEIRQPEAKTAEEPRTRRAWLRPVVVGPALAGALAFAVVAGMAVTGMDDGEGVRVGRDGKATYAFAPRVNADTKDNAPEVLARIATVAEKSKAVGGIRDDQFVYIRSTIAFVETFKDKAPRLDPLHRREIWESVDGSRWGLLREPGMEGNENEPMEPEAGPGETGYDLSTSYRHLQTLPTDPDEMLKWIYDAVERVGSDKEPDQAAFVLVGDLIKESMVPPKVSAALYRAAAKIPGVVVVPDAVDATGRHGVGVARIDSSGGTRDEWIFDKKTMEYLGERSVATSDAFNAEPGQVLGTTAVLERAVVDKAGQLPRTQKSA